VAPAPDETQQHTILKECQVTLIDVDIFEAKSTKRKLTHPPPINNSAKKSRKELKKVGISNFSDLELPYWEPRYLHESKESYNRRRHSEGTTLNKFISKEKDRRGIKDTPKTKTMAPLPPPSRPSLLSKEPDTPHTLEP